MKYKASTILLIGLSIFSLASPLKALACLCREDSDSPCKYVNDASVIFTGKALKITTHEKVKNNQEYSPPKNTVLFQTEEVFLGNNKRKTISIETGGGWDCSFLQFKRDRRYVVFASDIGDNLHVSKCSGTQLLSDHDTPLDYLRDLKNNKPSGTIYGSIRESIFDYSATDSALKPMGNVTIQALQLGTNRQFFYGKTNQYGRYAMHLPIGRYLISPILRDGLFYGEQSKNKPIKIGLQQCTFKTFGVANNSMISGRLITASGNLPRQTSLSLIPVGKLNENQELYHPTTFLDNYGMFSFRNVPIGKYQLAINYFRIPTKRAPYPTFFYPKTTKRNLAKVFEIGYGTRISGITFQLPQELNRYNISGNIIWENGKPAKNATVRLIDIATGDTVFYIEKRTNNKGEFVLNWFGKRKIRLETVMWRNLPDGKSEVGIAIGRSKIFTLDSSLRKITIVLGEMEKNLRYYRSIRKTRNEALQNQRY